MSFRDWKIGTKLAGGFAVILVMLSVMLWVGVSRLTDAAAVTNKLVNYDGEKTNLTYKTRGLVNGCFTRLSVFTDVKDPAQIQADERKIDDDLKTANENLDKITSMLETEKGKAAVGKARDDMKALFDGPYVKYKEALAANKREEAGALLTGDLMKARETMLKSFDEFTQLSEDLGDKHAKEGMEAMASGRTMMLAVGGCILLACIVIGVVITRSITAPLAVAVDAARALARGNTGHTFKIEAHDESGLLLEALSDVRTAFDQLRTAAERLAAGDVSVTVKPLSDEDRLSQAFQKLLTTMQNLLNETHTLVEAGKNGELSRRGNAQAFENGFRKLVENVNALLDAVILPINEAASVLDKVAARDMTARVVGEYKGDLNRIKDALNQTVQTLETALAQVSDASEEVAAASNQISDGSQALAQGASEQASTLEEIHSSLQEMASMTQLNSSNAQEAKGLTEAALQVSEKGMSSMTRLQSAIDKIKQSSDATARVVKTIDEIAFQTNLLALNAAVEAARAGDAGKGFAVVAEEVRNLAMRSAEHAKNTAALIEEAVRNAEGGVLINAEVVENLQAINSSVSKVTDVMGEIAASSEQQSQGVGQIKTAVEQLNQVTQQVAASSEELASASEELSGQAGDMKSMVSRFRLSQSSQGMRKPARLSVPPPTSTRTVATPALPSLAMSSAGGNGHRNGNGNGHATKARNLIPFDQDDDVLGEF